MPLGHPSLLQMGPPTALRDRRVHELIQVCLRACDESLNLVVCHGKRYRRPDTTNASPKRTQFDLARPACYTNVIRCRALSSFIFPSVSPRGEYVADPVRALSSRRGLGNGVNRILL